MSVDTREARDMCLHLVTILDDLDGMTSKHKSSAEKAAISSQLLFAAHCADLVRVEVLSQYHIFKGREGVPLIAAA